MARMKNWPEGYQGEIEEILGAPFERGGNIKLGFNFDTVPEARLLLKEIRLKQKQLRLVKKNANQEMREIRAVYKVKREEISDSGAFTGLLFGKRTAGRERQRKKSALSQNQKEHLLPYENVKNSIDQINMQFDGVKLQVEKFIAENS